MKVILVIASLIVLLCQVVQSGNVTVSESNVRFLLWTRSNRQEPFELFTNQRQLILNSPFNARKPVKILIHGFAENGVDSDFAITTREAYLSNQDVNVITVDWSGPARGPNYIRAAKNTRRVGMFTAQFIDFLIRQQTPVNNLHVIGFSMGCHVAGWTADHMQFGRLPRISALDPAGPGFERPPLFRLLTSSDADFVDVIHTNGLPVFGAGLTLSIGHADFYPNGGEWQPGCKAVSQNVNPLHFCPHARAYQYFAESIRARPGDKQFLATICATFVDFIRGLCGFCITHSNACVLMGEHTPSTTRGRYFLITNDRSPFALGPHVITHVTRV